MKNNHNNLKIISFYRFVRLVNKASIKSILDDYLKNKLIKGTILISDEGVNGFISGKEQDSLNALVFIKKLLRIRKFFKNSRCRFYTI